MANELQHKDAGLELTRVEDNAVNRHSCDGQVAGDTIYAQDGTVLRRLAIGSNGDVYWINGGLPAWKTPGIADNDPLAVDDAAAANGDHAIFTASGLEGVPPGIADNSPVEIDDAAAASGEHVRFTANGIEGFEPVSARAYQANAQTIPSGATTEVLLETEVWDTGNDMDVTLRTANCDATQAFKLHDADGGFEAGDVGATVWNTTDNTYAIVTVFVDSGELTIDTDIMVNGEGYKLFRSWFVCPADGKYLACGGIHFAAIADQRAAGIAFFRNGARDIDAAIAGGAPWGPGLLGSALMDCSANDYIQLGAYHSDPAVEALTANAILTWMAVHRLS